MQIRLKRLALGLGLVALIMGGCGRPATATVLPLPPAGAAVAPGADEVLSGLGAVLSGTPGPTPAPLAPALPPGSGRLVYDDGEYREKIMIVPASGGPAVPSAFPNDRGVFTLSTRSPWSPDGRSAISAYRSFEEGALIIVAADADGTNLRELARFSDEDAMGRGDFVWSPDGSKAAFVVKLMASAPTEQGLYSNKRLVVVDVAGGSARVVHEDVDLDDYHLAWSPDSATLAFSTGESHDRKPPRTLQTIRWDGSDRKILVKGVYVRGLFWPSDGGILFEVSCDGSDRTALCQLDPASGDYQPLYRTPDREDNLSFESMSPDEQWLFAQDYRRRSLLVINRRTGAVETISVNSGAFYTFNSNWSPDSAYLAIWGEDGLTYVHELGSGQPLRPLISERVLAWLPDE